MQADPASIPLPQPHQNSDPASNPLPQPRQNSDLASNPLPQSQSVNLVKCPMLTRKVWTSLILILILCLSLEEIVKM